MAKTKSISRKKLLKEPDEFITFTGRLIQFMRSHQKEAVWLAGGFLVLVLAISAVRFSIHRSEQAAFKQLAEAMAAYSEAVEAQDASAAMDKTAERFDTLIEEHDGRTAGKIARIVYAGYAMDAGDAEKAVDLYRRALKDFGSDEMVSQVISNGLAYAYEAKGDVNQAIASFEKINSGDASVFSADALFNLARLYEQKGDTARSKGLYQKLLDDHPEAIYAPIAKERLGITSGEDAV